MVPHQASHYQAYLEKQVSFVRHMLRRVYLQMTLFT